MSDEIIPTDQKRRKRTSNLHLNARWRTAIVPLLLLAPALILLIIFRYIPTLSAVFHSFTIWNILFPEEFVGLKNYQDLLQDSVFLQSLRNILQYAIMRTLLTMTMAFVGAELVYNIHNARWRNIWRLVFTIPMVIPLTVELMIWKEIYAGRQGLLNEFLVAIGVLDRAYPWLGRPDTALWALIFVGFPAVAGFGFLVLLAALQNLPSEVNEAALLDGCSRLQCVFAIDLPNIRGPLALILILSLNSGLQQFAPMLVMTNGGPANTTMSPAFYLYWEAFKYGKQGYASAIGVILLLMTLGLSILILWSRYRSASDVTA